MKGLAVFAVLLSLSGAACVRRTWTRDWRALSGQWRLAPDRGSATEIGSDGVVLIGARGSRFGERFSVWRQTFQVGEATARELNGKPVRCQADYNACEGVATDTGGGAVRVLLRMDPRLSRFAAAENIRIEIGGVSLALPVLEHGFDLDNGFEDGAPYRAQDVRCAAAEGRVLAAREAPRIQKDFAKGRVKEDERSRMETMLGAYLSNNYPACR